VTDERLRLFCALQLADDTLDCLVEWQRAHLEAACAARGGRIVPRADLHVTLAFLGSRPAGEVPAILGALRVAAGAARLPRFEIDRYRETRSVGMLVLREVDGDHAAALADDVQRRLEALAVYRRERRRWLAHVTVLRFRERAGLRPPVPNTCSVHVVRSALYRSSPGPDRGARYHVLDTAALGGR
jgi:RNA 2',3'-cyclic 3'-phosphodiesterase